MTASDTATEAQRNVTAATAATTAAGKAVTSATVKAAQITIDATVAATKSVTAVAGRAATDVANRSFNAATDTTGKAVTDTLTAQTREISLAWLDAYDAGFAAFLELGRTITEASKVEALTDLTEFNTQAMTEINATVTKAARELLN